MAESITSAWSTAACGLLTLGPNGAISAVNATFCRWTGYSSDELDGRPIRDVFSVGGRIYYETHLAPLLRMQGEVRELALDVVRRDGSRMPALVNAVSAPPGSGSAAAVQVAVFTAADRRGYEQELLHARREAERATEGSRRAQRRLAVLAEVSAAIADSRELAAALHAAADAVVRTWSDWCLIWLADSSADGGRLAVAAAAHRDPDRARLALQLARELDSSRKGVVPRAARPRLLEAPAQQLADSVPDDAGMSELCQRLGAGSALAAPLTAEGRHLGLMLIARGQAGPAFTRDDVPTATDLAARTALAVETLRLHGLEHAMSVALQRILLTPVMVAADLDVATRYLPAASHAQVGGDWYDTILRPDDSTVLVIGDVVGHGNAATAAMSQLRTVIRTVAYLGDEPPDRILSHADTAAHGLRLNALATALVAVLARERSDPATPVLSWSNAGHLPPILLAADGKVTLLERDPELLVGVNPAVRRTTHQVRLHADHTVLLFTDGLVERRREHLDAGLDRLCRLLPPLATAELPTLCDAVLTAMLDPAGQPEDDVALLAVRGLCRGAEPAPGHDAPVPAPPRVFPHAP
jgi:PAS domain S-box-containing protein